MRNSDPGEFAANHGVHARGLDLRPVLPQSTDQILGIDLTHTIHTDEVAAARGGPGGGGGGGGGGTTTFGTYTSGAAGAYNITIEFKGTSWTTEYYNLFVAAADRLSSIIVGDVEDAKVIVGKGGPKVVDDILITAELGQIDGLYNILGQAGPTSVRTVGSLPATATMKFDIVDVEALGLTVFSQVVLHEMAHSLGFGSIWDRLGLVTDGVFTGSNAVQQYHNLGGTAAGIAVEQDGGTGTAGSHWDEDTFHNELMTGYIDSGENPFSAMSAASFADLGYVLSGTYASHTDAYAVI
jgi:hypothetical protein